MKHSVHKLSRRATVSLALGAFLSSSAWAIDQDEVEVLRERYSETLRVLATEGIEPATRVLVDFETGIALQQGASGLDRLREVELETARDLAIEGAQHLLPLIALHEQAHLADSPGTLAADPYHTRAMIFLLTELYSEQLRSSGDREITSDLFVSLAGYFQEGSQGPAIMSLYRRALLFNPENEAALLGMATAREQLGRYRNALSLLQRLAETGSEAAEARLRLAVNLERLGEREEAARILAGLTEDAAPDWVAVVAFHQLARIRLSQGRLESARDLLARGLTRYPDDPGLALGLSWVEERLGSTSDLPFIVTEPLELHKAPAPSARYLYARPEYPYIETIRVRLRELAQQYLPDLARALSSLPSRVE